MYFWFDRGTFATLITTSLLWSRSTKMAPAQAASVWRTVTVWDEDQQRPELHKVDQVKWTFVNLELVGGTVVGAAFSKRYQQHTFPDPVHTLPKDLASFSTLPQLVPDFGVDVESLLSFHYWASWDLANRFGCVKFAMYSRRAVASGDSTPRGRFETRSRAKDDLRRAMQVFHKVRKWSV